MLLDLIIRRSHRSPLSTMDAGKRSSSALRPASRSSAGRSPRARLRGQFEDLLL